jgi:hypothetical protein
MLSTIVVAIIGSLLSLVGTLLILNLRSIQSWLRKAEQRFTSNETDIKSLQTSFGKCKIDCERNFVDQESFLRETGLQRRTLEKINDSVNRLDGKLTVVEKLPGICGDIARAVVKEMKNGEKNG